MSGLIQLMIATPAERIANAVREIVEKEWDAGTMNDLHARVMAVSEKPLLEAVMFHVMRNQTHAAKMLGINRNTLRAKIKRHGVKV